MTKLWNVKALDGTATTQFAIEEFSRLIKKLDKEATVAYDAEGGVEIGLSDMAPEVTDKALDDSILIDVKDGVGIIAGSNPRSVLFATYRYFRELGVSYVRPGHDGELVPELDSSRLCSVYVSEKAAYRYRGLCLEGSAGYEHVIETIDFLPKLGMNIFFTQLWRPNFTFDRWYGNKKSPGYVPSVMSNEAQDMLLSEYDKEIRLRGLDHHRMGHGFIPAIFGEKSGLWHGISEKSLINDSNRELLPLIDGKREFCYDSAIDSSLCYGNPRAQKLFIDEVVNYAVAHPEEKNLHVWLADMPNNQCECELCRDTLPSDFYVELLNGIDGRLTELGLDTRIIFLSYLELFWTPKKARLKNPDRFALLYAPIRRPYYEPLSAQRRGNTVPFKRNKWENPCSDFSALKYLDDWKKIFKGDCILFDYHLMWDSYNDVVGEKVARMLCRDMLELSDMGMQGMISCQGIRYGMFGQLSMRLMSDALWFGKLDIDKAVDSFYSELYGDSVQLCRDVLNAVSSALEPNVLRGVTQCGENHAKLCAVAKKKIKETRPIVLALADKADFAMRISYIYLSEQLRLSDKLIDFLLTAIEGKSRESFALWGEVLRTVYEIERLYPGALDGFEFPLVWHRHVLPIFFPQWNLNYDAGEITM